MAVIMDDLLLEEDGDIYIGSGDFVIGESAAEHQKQLLLNTKGEFRENPTMCVGAFNFLDDEQHYRLIREIHVTFSRDGMNVASVQITSDGKVLTDAAYE